MPRFQFPFPLRMQTCRSPKASGVPAVTDAPLEIHVAGTRYRDVAGGLQPKTRLCERSATELAPRTKTRAHLDKRHIQYAVCSMSR